MKTSKDLDSKTKQVTNFRQKSPKTKLNCEKRGNTKVPSSTSIAKFKSVDEIG